MSEIEFPRYNDLPPRFLFFSVDQTVLVASAVTFGAVTKNLLPALVIGCLLAWLVGKWRDARPDGYLVHLLYWYGVLWVNGRSALNPFLRKILPL